MLQEREFERVGGLKRLPLRARIVAATNRDLAREVAAGRFREDLYQRLKVVTIGLPPLRERAQDIPLLAQHLLARIGERLGKKVTKLPAEAMAHLMALPWPGNVRELENALIRAVVMAPGDMLLREHLPPLEEAAPDLGGVREEPGALLTLAEAEQQAIAAALAASKGHKGKACRILGISRPTLERKLRKYEGEKPGSDDATAAAGPRTGRRARG